MSFPSLFALASSKEVWVVDMWLHSSEGGGWTSNFSRLLNDWKIETVECFLSRLQDKMVDVEREARCFRRKQRVNPSLLSPSILSLGWEG